jgi:hypothetical protein
VRPMTSKEDAVRAAGKVMDTVFEKGVDEELGALEGEELLHVVPLRRLGKRLGCEKLILKQDTGSCPR